MSPPAHQRTEGSLLGFPGAPLVRGADGAARHLHLGILWQECAADSPPQRPQFRVPRLAVRTLEHLGRLGVAEDLLFLHVPAKLATNFH